MKKKIAFIISGLMLSGLASAAGTVLPENKKVTQLDCELLNEDVQLALSTNVVAAYECRAANRTIYFAGCSTAGRVSSRTAEVDVPEGCGVADADGNIATPCTGKEPKTVSGSVVSLANSMGGQLQQTFPGGVCEDDGEVAASAIQ